MQYNYLFFFKGDIGLSGLPGEKGVQGDPGKSGKKVRKYILLPVKPVDERSVNRYLQVYNDKEFILEERLCQYFRHRKGTRLVEKFLTISLTVATIWIATDLAALVFMGHWLLLNAMIFLENRQPVILACSLQPGQVFPGTEKSCSDWCYLRYLAGWWAVAESCQLGTETVTSSWNQGFLFPMEVLRF